MWNIPRKASVVARFFSDASPFDIGIAVVSGAVAVYNAFAKNDWLTAVGAAIVCILAIGKAIISFRKNLSQKSLHELEGCLHTLHAMIHKENTHAWITLHVPIEKGQRFEQLLDYVSNDSSYSYGVGRKFAAQSGVIGAALNVKDAALAVRQNNDYEAYIRELKAHWAYTDADARKINPATMSAFAAPLTNYHGDVGCVLYCGSTDRDLFTPEVIALIGKACIGIALFIGKRYSS